MFGHKESTIQARIVFKKHLINMFSHTVRVCDSLNIPELKQEITDFNVEFSKLLENTKGIDPKSHDIVLVFFDAFPQFLRDYAKNPILRPVVEYIYNDMQENGTLGGHVSQVWGKKSADKNKYSVFMQKLKEYLDQDVETEYSEAVTTARITLAMGLKRTSQLITPEKFKEHLCSLLISIAVEFHHRCMQYEQVFGLNEENKNSLLTKLTTLITQVKEYNTEIAPVKEENTDEMDAVMMYFSVRQFFSEKFEDKSLWETQIYPFLVALLADSVSTIDNVDQCLRDEGKRLQQEEKIGKAMNILADLKRNEGDLRPFILSDVSPSVAEILQRRFCANVLDYNNSHDFENKIKIFTELKRDYPSNPEAAVSHFSSLTPP